MTLQNMCNIIIITLLQLLNRSVGDPLIETRIDLDESHISVISGLHDHSVILHDPVSLMQSFLNIP